MMSNTPPNSYDHVSELIGLADGLTLSQVCSITGLESSTIQNWVKRGFVPHPTGKRYDSRLLARIRVISMLRDVMRIEQIGELMAIVNGNTDDTGDDIISEEELLKALLTAHELVKSGDDVELAAGKVSCNLVDKSDEPRLRGALTVMILARIAGQYKEQAENAFNELKSKF